MKASVPKCNSHDPTDCPILIDIADIITAQACYVKLFEQAKMELFNFIRFRKRVSVLYVVEHGWVGINKLFWSRSYYNTSAESHF